MQSLAVRARVGESRETLEEFARFASRLIIAPLDWNTRQCS